MSTRIKLTLLELIAGIFGWIWIGASLAAIYFIAMTIFSNGLWSLFFWAIGISIFSKWLAEGFDNSKERVAYEAKLIDEGYSAKEAGEICFRVYTGASKMKTHKFQSYN